jgi:hypothetical protein
MFESSYFSTFICFHQSGGLAKAKKYFLVKMLKSQHAPVAQWIRAPVFGTGCRRFESCLAHQNSKIPNTTNTRSQINFKTKPQLSKKCVPKLCFLVKAAFVTSLATKTMFRAAKLRGASFSKAFNVLRKSLVFLTIPTFSHIVF